MIKGTKKFWRATIIVEVLMLALLTPTFYFGGKYTQPYFPSSAIASEVPAGAEFIIGPQAPIDPNSWFDTTELNRARVHGEANPAVPPTEANALNSFVLLHYYDLAMTEYIAHSRSGDPIFLEYARRAADSWWLHPQWIQGGVQRDFDNGRGPAPRHAGIGGLILRALDGRPEMWDWITAYTRHQFNNWVKVRVNNPGLYYGVREGAFMLHYATWIAATHPDPVVRAEFLADVEFVSVNYFGRLQYPDGSWRWDDFDFVDSDGGTLKGITQPFMVGLLLNALIDVHRLTTNPGVKASIQNQLTQSCLSLFNGPYRQFEPTGLPGVNFRGFWYFYYGGTSVNPTRYASGGGSYTAADVPTQGTWVIKNDRQGISTIFSAYAYVHLITGNPIFRSMGDELVDSAFIGSDGFRGFADDTAKNYNQNYRMGGRYFGWLGGGGGPSPTPTPTPTPEPTPEPSPSPTPTPEPDATPPTASITAPSNGATVSGSSVVVTATASDNVGVDTTYLIVDGVVSGSDHIAPYSYSLNTTTLANGTHSMYIRAWDASGNAGDSAQLSFTVANGVPTPTPTPSPTPEPTPTPTPEPTPGPCVKFNANGKCIKTTSGPSRGQG